MQLRRLVVQLIPYLVLQVGGGDFVADHSRPQNVLATGCEQWMAPPVSIVEHFLPMLFVLENCSCEVSGILSQFPNLIFYS